MDEHATYPLRDLTHPAGTFVPFRTSEIEQSIPSRFGRIVSRHAEKTAVRFRGAATSYRDLNARAGGVASALSTLPPEPEDAPVAPLAGQGSGLIAGILGILASGRPYLPLDVLDPPRRLSTILAASGALCVLADAAHLALAGSAVGPGIAVLALDGISPADGPVLGAAIRPDAPAYIYYTSGSTGSAKGVADSHRNVLHNIMRYTNALRISSTDRLSLVQAPAFSGAVSSMFAALLNGATLCPYDLHADGLGANLADWIAGEELTMFHSVPAVFRGAGGAGRTFPSVRTIRLEGDAASVRDVEHFRRHFSQECVLVNGLGTTETGLVRQFFLRRTDDPPGGILPIGYAVDGMEVVLLDPDGQELPPGATGEIAVKSRYLASGYWRDPDRTALAFVPDPADRERRIYRTGDLGRMAADGCLTYLGRKDLQCKVRGNRVDPADVESRLLTLPSVKDAAVTVRSDGAWEGRLVAYIVPASAPPPVQAVLRRALATMLPNYMIPTRFVMMDALPLGANLKVDRRLLPDPAAVARYDARPYRPPADGLEAALAAIWESILGIAPVGADDDFFDLGGDSLSAAGVYARVEEELGVALNMSTLFDAPTVARLARALGDASRRLHANPAVLRVSGPGLPLVCIHGHQGHIHPFAALSRHVDAPVYAFASVGLAGEEMPLPTVGAMAERYLADLRKVRPEGPYLLAGFCFGGLVALEMARMLPREAVARVILFDVTPAEFPSLFPADAVERYRSSVRVKRRAFHAANLARLGSAARAAYLWNAARAGLLGKRCQDRDGPLSASRAVSA